MNPSTQKEIFKEYYELVYGLIFYLVKDHATTEDLIQETFLHILRKMPDIDSEGKLKGWIRTVVKNRVYTYLRRNKKLRNEIADDSVSIMDELVFVSGAESIEAEVETKMMSEAIGRCLQDLKPEYRALIELRWKQELSYKEMADVLDTSEQTIKHKLHRAREAMKKRFVKLWGEQADARRIR
ncbi:RNA polymerase sigma factor [Cohnella thailandensis]|uniref:Sigma-70 family RNA polymerase sigma factor n=1 Tax=Cohnella thailandensis TaxID=557557 RepID=A0A841T5X4_9BACL|nr:sigma-70 family RNA polymerase sigma factor [Cohnella thailandensis]MBB6637708.1 sigma-70 family RNA polymerase sigma factor [Cohnella thailandensis]MBP1974115.1 RNA polymerase sigma-70 factor (ECF subfamily) [Cohnella thailandensis]